MSRGPGVLPVTGEGHSDNTGPWIIAQPAQRDRAVFTIPLVN